MYDLYIRKHNDKMRKAHKFKYRNSQTVYILRFVLLPKLRHIANVVIKYTYWNTTAIAKLDFHEILETCFFCEYLQMGS